MITPKTLFLDGWLSYDKETIDLTIEGLTYVSGPIGAGKSAIPEAIYYLMYGKTLRGKDSVNDLVNKILDAGYEISLTLDIDEVEYTIKEIRGRSDSGLFFSKGDRDLRGKTDPDTRKRIIATLGMSDQTFQSIGFLGQNQTQVLVEGTPGARGKALVDIYALDEPDKALKILKDDLASAKNDKAAAGRALEQLQGDIEAIQETVTEDIPEEDFEGGIEEISKKIIKAKKKIERLRELSNTLIAKIAKQKSLREQQQRLADIERKIEDKRAKLKDMKKPKQDLQELSDTLRDLRKQQVLLVAEVNASKREIDKAERLVNTCPITDSDCPVDVPKTHKEKIISKCKKAISAATKKENDATVTISELEEVKKAANAHAALRGEIDADRRNLETLRGAEQAEDTTEDEKKLQKCRDSLHAGADKVGEYQETREGILSRKAAFAEVQELKKKLETALSEKTKQVKRKKREILKYDEELKYISAAVAVFKKAKLYKIDIVLELLNKNIQDILKEISGEAYSAEFISQKKAESSSRLLDKISIMVHDDYKSMPIELWSGGQKTEVGLAVLLSVWKTATDLAGKSISCLWLDEVFGPLDRDIIDRVFESVLRVVEEIGTTSVKVISHRDLDERLFDETWEVKQDVGISYLTVR